MAIPPEEVRRIAALARLEIPDDEVERVARELSAVLDYAQVLRRLDLDGCEASGWAPADAGLRPDEPGGRGLSREDALAMAPEVEGGFFVVPPVLETPEP